MGKFVLKSSSKNAKQAIITVITLTGTYYGDNSKIVI